MAKKWMQTAFSKHPGAFHKALGVPLGQKIPESKMEMAEHSKSGHMRAMANLAMRGKEAQHRGPKRKTPKTTRRY